MAPKKDKKGKKDEPVQPELVTAYLPREPEPQPDPPDSKEADGAWKAARNQYSLPLPVWNADAVDVTEWKPNETESRFVSDQFSIKALSRNFLGIVSGWRRAGAAALAKGDLLPEEAEPQAQPLPDIPDEPEEPPPDPKAKAKAKSDPKAKAKAKGAPEEPPTPPSTMQQYADCEYAGDARVVSQQEFRSRDLILDTDESWPSLSQAIAAQFAAVAEHKLLVPKGYYLWELIYPQDDEGVPLYNPHGKYIIKLFVQGRWRQVLIDDVVPVGFALHGMNVYAPVLPSSPNVNVIWPQLLAKGLMRAFQDDLGLNTLPCITALTGWLPYQMPLSWGAVQGLHNVRPFCCLQMNNQVNDEARQRGGDLAAALSQPEDARGGRKSVSSGAAAVPALNLGGEAVSAPTQQPLPKLGNQPCEAVLEFVICEMEEEPRQVRLKAGLSMPQHGTPRKLTREAESEDEDGSADETAEAQQATKTDDEIEDSEKDDPDEDDDERSSPAGDAATQQSAQDGEGADGGDPALDGSDAQAEEDSKPWVAPWREDNPAPLIQKSDLQLLQAQLIGGFWVSFDDVEAHVPEICCYIPPSDHVITACLDTTWSSERKDAYSPSQPRLLRINLVPKEEQRPPKASEASDAEDKKPPPGPAWLQAVLFYEPLRQHGVFVESSGSSPTVAGCMLQAMDVWRQPLDEEVPVLGKPQKIHLSAGDGTASTPSFVYHSLTLPPGEHWYLVYDDAATQSGSVLSVGVEGFLCNVAKSSIEFLEPAKALDDIGISVLTVGPMEYPMHTGYRVWTKAEVLLALDVISGEAPSVQLLCHVSDVTLWPYLQLTCLRMMEEDKSSDAVSEDNRCASWSVSTMIRSPLLPVMSVPLQDVSDASSAAGGSAKFVLMLEANLPPDVVARSGGNFSMQLFLPPSTFQASPSVTGDKESADGGDAGDAGAAGDGEKESPPGPLQLHLLTVDKVLRWRGECTLNDKALVLCERIKVPPEHGDVTSTLHISVEGLPQAYLKATLVAQMPPKEEMRPDNVDGTRPEPLVRGQPINPRDYSGRRNWLSRCKVVAEASGLEAVSFPHVLMTESSTYIMYVYLDTFRGPSSLEGGSWLLESFGSGAIEVGADAMEIDLEDLVRQSWAVTLPEDDGQPPRAEVAAASRKAWLAKASGEAGEEQDAAAADDEEAVPTEEQQELAAALSRAKEVVHPNNTIDSFLRGHAEVDAVLVMEDPYTVAPDKEEQKAPAEDTDVADAPAEPVLSEDTEESGVAIRAFGTLGARAARTTEVEESDARWQKAQEDLDTAKERNVNYTQEMRQWREDRSAAPGGAQAAKFAPQRDALRGALRGRLEKCAILKAAALDPDRTDPEPLRAAIQEAETSGANHWDVELMDKATCKLRVLDATVALRTGFAAAETKIEEAAAAAASLGAAEAGSDGFTELEEAAAARAEERAEALTNLEKAILELNTSIKEASAKSVTLPQDVLNPEPLERATALVDQQRPVPAEEEAA
eukprot:TRINITY_DN25548_c0_g1_i1.p1 TRINITY_DN25548_c0_g1~~TRINITY_DN25548_c0_g1_i1.p1  ORF type:complete len:1495 (+),score=364.04 TRINITY_DN25548_c0_g1_i1:66-4550(+)